MDISLQRVLSLISKKPDGHYVHGAKKNFCELIGAPTNIVNEWERGTSRSYRGYLYAIAAKYDVSVEWLKGETDDMGGTGRLRESVEKEKLGSQQATERAKEFVQLFEALTPDQQEFFLAQLRGVVNPQDK